MGIATFLKTQLAERGWTQKDLAERADMQPGSLTYIMKRDHIVPQLETLDTLAQALDLPLAQLIAACGFKVSRPGDVYLTTDDSDILVEIANHPDLQRAAKTILSLPPMYQRIVFSLVGWAKEESTRPFESEEEHQAARAIEAAYQEARQAAQAAHEKMRETVREAQAEREHTEILREATDIVREIREGHLTKRDDLRKELAKLIDDNGVPLWIAADDETTPRMKELQAQLAQIDLPSDDESPPSSEDSSTPASPPPKPRPKVPRRRPSRKK